MGLRSLFALVEELVRRFRYLDETIAVVLAIVGVKLLLEEVRHIGRWRASCSSSRPSPSGSRPRSSPTAGTRRGPKRAAPGSESGRGAAGGSAREPRRADHRRAAQDGHA
jgi:hypothetical protein